MVTHYLTLRGGGVATVVESLSREVLALNSCTRVFGLEHSDAGYESSVWSGAPAITGKVCGPQAFGYSKGLKIALKDFRPDIIHSHGLWMHPSSVVRKSAGSRIPYLVSPHGMLEQNALKISRWKKEIAARIFEYKHLTGAACIHALNENEVKDVRKFGLSQPIAVIPNGVSLPLSSASTSESDKDNFGIQEKNPELLFLGRLHPKKNIESLIKAFGLVDESKLSSEWSLNIVGSAARGYREKLELCARETSAANKIKISGPLYGASKSAAFERATAFVLPSYSEGQPMAILEAWSFGKPVAMSRECNLPEGFKAGAAFEIATTPSLMAEQLTEFLAMNDSKHSEMGRAGRDLVEANFSWSAAASSMNKLYGWLLGENGAPDFLV